MPDRSNRSPVLDVLFVLSLTSPQPHPHVARSQAQYLSDIDQAMTDVRDFASGRDLEDYRQDRQLRYAIERVLEIVGEATANLSDEVKEQDPSIPWREMRGLRNIVAHVYHRVDPVRVWTVVTRDLPQTHEKIQRLLEQVREEEEGGQTDDSVP